MSILSCGEETRSRSLSLREEALVERERERDSRRRLLFASRDLERFLVLSLSLDRDLLRFLLCLLLFECLERDELRLRERPMVTFHGNWMPVAEVESAALDKVETTLSVLFAHTTFAVPNKGSAAFKILYQTCLLLQPD